MESGFQNGPLLDENDKKIISVIEQYVDVLLREINQDQLQKIVKIDNMAYRMASLSKESQRHSDKYIKIENISKKLTRLGERADIKKSIESRPFKELKMFDQEYTLGDILEIADDCSYEALIERLKTFAQHTKEKINSINAEHLRVKAKGAEEYASADQTVKNYINYKYHNGYSFEISEDGRLLKISRSEKGPKFSVIYFNVTSKHGKDVQRQQHKMVLYTGKDKVLGYGKYGKVKLLQDYLSNVWYAVKIQTTVDNKLFDIEVENLRKVGMLFDSITLSSRDKNYVAMELAKGVEALKLIKKYLFKDDDDKDLKVLRILSAAAKALQTLHDNKMIHRDVKLENFVYNPDEDKCKIIDYQFLALVDDDGECHDSKKMGSKEYLAPEILDATETKTNKFIYSRLTDIYAFGKILNMLNDHFNEQKVNDLIANYAFLFTKAVNIRPATLNDFIKATDLMIVNCQQCRVTTQPLLFTSTQIDSYDNKKPKLEVLESQETRDRLTPGI